MSAVVRRIAIIGAECVGKTELAQFLAEALPGVWVPEYLREFCDRTARTPLPEEQPQILAQQIAREEAAFSRAQDEAVAWVLADSAPLATAAYSELLFADRTLRPPAITHHANYDATLLLLPDLPWIADGIQRDGPAIRAACHDLLLRILGEAGLSYTLISGIGEARRQAALDVLTAL